MHLTVAIPTRNRLDSLVQCVRSLAHAEGSIREIIVVDDVSDLPLAADLLERLGADFPLQVRVIRNDVNVGPTASRNRAAALAETPYLLFLDDDTYLLSPDAVRTALDVVTQDPDVGVVAFAQAEGSGQPWPAGLQPAPVDYPAVIPCFVGFAHLVRREAFQAIGGYRDELFIFGEEKELSLRLLDAGYKVVYLPDALIAHVPNPSNRSNQRYLQFTVRNDLLGAIYNEPFPMLCASIPYRLYGFFVSKHGFGRQIDVGFGGFLRQYAGDLRVAWRRRRPLKWSTFRAWRALRQTLPRYAGPDGTRPDRLGPA